MMKLYWKALLQLAICFLCCYGNTAAQSKLSHNSSSLINTFWVQYNPATLMEPEVPVTATFLYKKSRWLGFALDAGFFVAFQNYSGKTVPYSGYRFKPEVKFYFENLPGGPHGLYVSVQGIIKRTFKTKEEWMNETDSAGQFLFSRLVNYQERKTVLGINVIFGGELIVDKNKRWSIDLYIGAGVRTKSFKALNLPSGFTKEYENRDPNRVFSIYRNGSYISFPAGLKVGYRLK